MTDTDPAKSARDVTFLVDGRAYTIRFTQKARCRLKKDHGLGTVADLLKALQQAAGLETLLQVGIEAGAAPETTIPPGAAETILDTLPINTVTALVDRALVLAFYGPDPVPAPVAAVPSSDPPGKP